MILFHLTTRPVWADAVKERVYRSPSLDEVGFIHCSRAEQVVRVANRFYRDVPDLLLLGIDAASLSVPVVMEEADEELFPHVYGPIELHAVFDVSEVERDEAGAIIPGEEVFFALHGERTLDDAKALARSWMDDFRDPWWIAGGWAIDCAIGRRTRPHADLELAVQRTSMNALYAHLRSYDVRVVTGPQHIAPWTGGDVPWHQVWVRRGDDPAPTWREFASDPSMIDVLLDGGDHTTWVSRRHPSITLPVREVGSHARDGTPFIKPEIQLLYKAKYRRWKDERDFANALPILDEEARRWLVEAIRVAYGDGHEWINKL